MGNSVAYKNIFGKSPRKGVDFELEGIDDLVEAHLLEAIEYGYVERSLIIPKYSIHIWKSLPDLVDFNKIVED